MASVAAPLEAAPSRTSTTAKSLTGAVAAFLVLAASFANFLTYHDYPFLRPETLMVLALLALVAGVYGLLYGRSGNLGAVCAETFLVLIAIDLNSDVPLLALGLALIFAAVRVWAQTSLLPVVSIISIVVLLSSLLGLSDKQPAIAREVGRAGPAVARPAILHLILDEHGGLAGTTDPQLRKELAAFYTERGFRLFSRAYSRHFHTVNAIPDMLNFGHPGSSKNVNQTLDIGRTEYISNLERQGYRLHLYQSEFADFCRYARAASCTRYWSPSLAFVEPLPIPAREKARLMGYKFVALSHTAVSLLQLYNSVALRPAIRKLGLPVVPVKQRGSSGSLGAFAVLDRMALDLRSARPGDAYFAHVLAPHYPYMMSRQCNVVLPSRWEYRRSARPVATREAAYGEQVRCLVRRLHPVISAFQSSPAGRDGVIVIHGDHGSRITAVEPGVWNQGKITANDFMAGYSTLFAVRSPGIERGIEERPLATPALLGQLSRGGFASRSLDQLQPGDGKIYLDGPDWKVGPPASINNAWPANDLTVR